MHLLQRYSSPSALFRPLLTRPLLLFTIPFISFSATSCLRCPPSRPHSAGPSSVVFLKPSYSPILSLFPFCQAIDPHCSLLNPFISLIFHTLFSFSLSHWFAHLHLHGLVRDQLNHHIEVPAKTLPVSTRVSRTTTENTRAETNDAACQSYNGERNSDERKRFGKRQHGPALSQLLSCQDRLGLRVGCAPPITSQKRGVGEGFTRQAHRCPQLHVGPSRGVPSSPYPYLHT